MFLNRIIEGVFASPVSIVSTVVSVACVSTLAVKISNAPSMPEPLLPGIDPLHQVQSSVTAKSHPGTVNNRSAATGSDNTAAGELARGTASDTESVRGSSSHLSSNRVSSRSSGQASGNTSRYTRTSSSSGNAGSAGASSGLNRGYAYTGNQYEDDYSDDAGQSADSGDSRSNLPSFTMASYSPAATVSPGSVTSSSVNSTTGSSSFSDVSSSPSTSTEQDTSFTPDTTEPVTRAPDELPDDITEVQEPVQCNAPADYNRTLRIDVDEVQTIACTASAGSCTACLCTVTTTNTDTNRSSSEVLNNCGQSLQVAGNGQPVYDPGDH